jgi:predicted negative regulator of RcsB-dependent stress response
MRNLPALVFTGSLLAIVYLAGWYVWHRNTVDDRMEVSRTAFQDVTIARMDAIDETHRQALRHIAAIDVKMAQLLQLYCTSPDGATRCKPDGTPR